MDARQLEAVLDCVFDCVVTLDGAGKVSATNLTTQETFGYTGDELRGKDLAELVLGGVDELLTGTQRKTPRRGGYVGCRYDGSQFPLELALTRVDHAGEPITVVTLRDVSEYARHTDTGEGFDDAPLSKAYELQELVDETTRDLERERATIELLLSVAYHANYSSSLREALAATLELLCNHLGWELGRAAALDACSGTFVANQLWFGPWQQAQLDAHRASAISNAAVRTRSPVVLRDKSLVDESALALEGISNGLALPILVEDQVVAVLEAYALQPTEAEQSPIALAKLIVAQLGLVAQREQREHALRRAAAVAEAATRQKSEFLSNMSHEFRTPMHAIINYTNLALRGVDRSEPERLKHYLNNVSVSARRLLALLNDILDLAKMDSGRFRCELVPASFDAVLDKTAAEVEGLLNAKGMRLERVPSTCSSTACFDEGRMVQVLVNLLSNSIKFSPEGSVVTVSLQDADMQGEAALECRVRDRGVGIPLDELETIFHKFQQSRRTNNGSGGTGLGLAISRQIVGAHHGRIWAENNAEGGADMVIWIPRANKDPVQSPRGLN